MKKILFTSLFFVVLANNIFCQWAGAKKEYNRVRFFSFIKFDKEVTANYITLDSLFSNTYYIDTTGMHGIDTIPLQLIIEGNKARIDKSLRFRDAGSVSGFDSIYIYGKVNTIEDSIINNTTFHNWVRSQISAIWVELGTPQPDFLSPTINAIEIGGYADNIFTIKWSENIYKDSCSLDGIVITENGNTFGTYSIWNNADSTYIRMDSIGVYGATYLLSYTRGADSSFCDSSYNYVANVSNHAITNNIEEIASLGPEKAVNGNFETGVITPWSVRADWNIQAASGGEYGSYWLRHTTGANNTEPQNINAVAGTSYDLVYDVVGMTAGSVRMRIGNTYGIERTANGHYTERIICTGDSYLRIDPITSTFDGAIDNISVKEVL